MWQKIRISILLVILLLVSSKTYLEQLDATDWMEPLKVVVYPINGDGSVVTERYITLLEDASFKDIETFIQSQARRYEIDRGLPVKVTLAPKLTNIPPQHAEDEGVLGIITYSLKLRLWAWMNGKEKADISMFVAYFDPETNGSVPSSLALQKGMLGVVYAYADSAYEGSNSVVIAHEMLHTVGATDKYSLETNMPLYPSGYANPYSKNRYPQLKAELMGGQVPFAENDAYMPDSLDIVVIGPQTAAEIKWIN
ncbi:MAG: hypothetical protein DSZ28_06930 [Thiothrix sp.]|nr:MAG: hypothetical protein DSZ28_06930 [Thiothrix sp.]